MKQKKFSAKLKAEIALEFIECKQLITEIAERHGADPNEIITWAALLIHQAEILFADPVANEILANTESVQALERKLATEMLESAKMMEEAFEQLREMGMDALFDEEQGS